jgi:RIO kinase 1
MRVPASLDPLLDMGIIEEVIRPLMSGKEAQLYLVVAGGERRVAKVYKQATERSFKQRASYTDGRSVRNSRDRRAMRKGSRHGRAKDEEAWRSAEVDVIYTLRNAGVRVPVPHHFIEGVLLMELITGPDGEPAPRLADVVFTAEEATKVYRHLIQEVVRMLCAGVVHGDLSEFNVLMGTDGPVIIDFPQSVDPVSNSSARSLLLRDVENLHRFLSRVTPHARAPFAQEMWSLFEKNELSPEGELRGHFRDKRRKANATEVLGLVADAARDEQSRRRGDARRGSSRTNDGQHARDRGPNRRGGDGPTVEVLTAGARGRTQVVRQGSPTPAGSDPQPAKRKRRRNRGRKRGPASPAAAPAGTSSPAASSRPPAKGPATTDRGSTPTVGDDGGPATKKKKKGRRRRRRRSGGAPDRG